jgi:ketosteroid isomerase-like protein
VTKPLPADFVEQFEEHFNCWNRGDLDLMLDDYAQDAVFDVSAVFTDVEVVHGREEIRRYWDTLRETWDNLHIDPVEGYALDDGRFVLDQRMWAKGTRSGIGVDQRFAMLYTLRPEDRKVLHAQLFPSVEAAISAAQSSAT